MYPIVKNATVANSYRSSWNPRNNGEIKEHKKIEAFQQQQQKRENMEQL